MRLGTVEIKAFGTPASQTGTDPPGALPGVLVVTGGPGAGKSVLPWSPLARGRLTRDWDTTTGRSETDDFGRTLYPEGDRTIVDAVARIADRRDVPRARVALAWLLHQSPVTAPIVGATKAHHIDDAVAAVDLELTDKEIEELGQAYTPHPVSGH